LVYAVIWGFGVDFGVDFGDQLLFGVGGSWVVFLTFQMFGCSAYIRRPFLCCFCLPSLCLSYVDT